jgi:hypothetical protein
MTPLGVPTLEGLIPLSSLEGVCDVAQRNGHNCTVVVQAHLRDPVRTQIVCSSPPVQIFLRGQQALVVPPAQPNGKMGMLNGVEIGADVLSLGCLASEGDSPSQFSVLRLFDPLCAMLTAPAEREIPFQWMNAVVSDVFVGEHVAAVKEFGVDPLKTEAVLLLKYRMARNDSRVNKPLASPELFSRALRQDTVQHWSAVTGKHLQLYRSASVSGIAVQWTLFMSNNATLLFDEWARLLRPGGRLRIVEVGCTGCEASWLRACA